jgi:hypothetical protein
MASTINVLTTGVGGVQTTGDTSGILQMQTNGTATLTIDTSGNVGIGTASPNYKLTVAGGISVGPGTDGGTGDLFLDNGTSFAQYGYILSWFTGANNARTERMRIDPNGAIGLGGANYGTSGQFLKSNGPGAAATWATAGGGFSNMQVFTSPGTFTTPATVTQVKVTVVGGGAPGGTGSPTGNYGGGGGGGGGGAIYVGPVSASTPYAVTVGAASGTSSFSTLASATGGSGGSNTPTNNAGGGGAAGGAGSAGTLQFNGGGGGGGSGSPAGTGLGGTGGNSLFGGGARSGAGATGIPGTAYGGGASGSSSLPVAQGTGAAGVVIVEY